MAICRTAGPRRRKTGGDRRADPPRRGRGPLPRRARPRPAVEAALKGRHALEIVETYAAEARKRWSSKEIQLLGGCGAALHYSRRSAGLAVELAERAGMGDLLKRMSHICISADTAGPIQAAGAVDVRIAARPDEASLFAMLIEAATVFPSLGGSRI